MKHHDDPQHLRDAAIHPVQSVTSAPMSAVDEQAERVRRYLVTMGFRVVCAGLALLASGWLRWVLVAGAVVLPYFAVVMANAVRPRLGADVAFIEPEVVEVRALDDSPTDDTDRTISGHVVDD